MDREQQTIKGQEATSEGLSPLVWRLVAWGVIALVVLAVALIFAGFLLYKEALTWNKLAGIAVCLAGIALINR